MEKDAYLRKAATFIINLYTFYTHEKLLQQGGGGHTETLYMRQDLIFPSWVSAINGFLRPDSVLFQKNFLFKIIFNPSYPCLKLEDLSKNTENTDFAGFCP